MIVTVRDSAGRLAPRETLSVSASLLGGISVPFGTTPAFFGLNKGVLGFGLLRAMTDSAGRLVVWVRTGGVAGPIRVRASSRFGKDSLDGTVLPGHTYGFSIAPRDTGLYVNATLTPTIIPRDRFNNATADVYVLTARRPSVLDATGSTLTARGTGRAFVVATAGDARDSVAVSVVPAGTLVANPYLYSSSDAAAFFMFGLDGSDYHAFARGTGGYDDRGPRWSAALGRIVYHQGYGSGVLGNTGLYDIAPGGTPHPLLSPLVVSDGSTTGNEYASIRYASVSADGGTIYFAATTTYNETSIWRARSDGTGAVRVGPATTIGSNDSQPSAAPDGRRLVYITDRGSFGSGVTRLMLLDLTTGVSLSMATNGTHPVWSPVGDEIAYFNQGLSVVRADGTGETVLVRSDKFDTRNGQIDWSPDGKWLVSCMTGTYSGDRQLVVIDRASGEVLPLASTAKDRLCEATWRR